MRDAETAQDPAQEAAREPRRPWSTPTVILSTVRSTSLCYTTQSVGQVEVKNPKSTPGTTSNIS